MELLIGHNKKVLEQLEKEIDVVQNQLKEMSTLDVNEKFNQTVEKLLDTWEKDIQDIKTKKFSRDLNDFQQNRVFRWKLHKPFRGRSRISSVSSAASSQDDSRPFNRSMTTRFGGKTKNKRNDEQKHANNKQRNDANTSVGKRSYFFSCGLI